MSTCLFQMEILSLAIGGSGTKSLHSLFSDGKKVQFIGFFPISNFLDKVLAVIVEVCRARCEEK